MFEDTREGVSGHRLLLALALTDAVPALRRDIHRPAQREPDLPGWHAVADRLLSGHSPDVAEHEIASEHSAVCVTELVADCQPKLAQSHASTLNEERPGLDRGVRSMNTSSHTVLLLLLPRDEIRVELRDEVVWQGVWDRGEALNYREAVAHFAHDDRDRSFECIRYRREDL